MMVFFSSALHPQGGHLVLTNHNSFQYILNSPNPTSLYMAITSI